MWKLTLVSIPNTIALARGAPNPPGGSFATKLVAAIDCKDGMGGEGFGCKPTPPRKATPLTASTAATATFTPQARRCRPGCSSSSGASIRSLKTREHTP
eukprot:CAMPEP_0179280930 /NCGR_PEP_ID=MMETSP0797-20121207/36883_1 /TAXON_ID=47934 /ORGANISM="Dinophysis acuminata, Strain DAEP01" /LENGTH=98 /DNA_ID=CAMNT_0020989605 /DNA_START=166 /DNA_END=459 /DNA_ORIENTATION=+